MILGLNRILVRTKQSPFYLKLRVDKRKDFKLMKACLSTTTSTSLIARYIRKAIHENFMNGVN